MPPTPLPILRIIKNLARNCLPPTLPIPLPYLPLNLPRQIPEIPIMFAPHIMRQLMTQRIPNDFIIAIPIVRIGPEPQLNDFAPVAVQTEGFAVVGGVLGRVHFCENADAEFVFAHGGLDAGVGAEAGEVGEGAGGVGEVGEGEEGVEGVGCFFLRFAPVAVGGGGCGFEGGVWGARGGVGGGGEGGELGGGWGEEDDLFGEEGCEGEGGCGEGGFEDAEFGRYEEFLVGGGDGEVGVDAGGEVGDC